MNRFFMLLFLLGSFFSASAQTQQQQFSPVINQKDASGKPDGWWWVVIPAGKGEEAYTTFGIYTHGVRYGLWYKVSESGELIAIENYRDNVLNGEAKYFDLGKLYCTGSFRGLNAQHAYDTIVITHPVTGLQSLKAVPTEKGSVRDGKWRYYDPETGRLVREEEYQVDELIARKDFMLNHEDSTYYQKVIKQLPHNQTRTVRQKPGHQPGF